MAIEHDEDDPYAIYKVPAGVADGVWILLPGGAAEFLIALPSKFNEPYQTAVMRAVSMNAVISGDGVTSARVDPMRVQVAQRDAFKTECVIEVRGLPRKYGTDAVAFLDAHPIALVTLMERAFELSLQGDKEVDEALGKLRGPSQTAEGDRDWPDSTPTNTNGTDAPEPPAPKLNRAVRRAEAAAKRSSSAH